MIVIVIIVLIDFDAILMMTDVDRDTVHVRVVFDDYGLMILIMIILIIVMIEMPILMMTGVDRDTVSVRVGQWPESSIRDPFIRLSQIVIIIIIGDDVPFIRLEAALSSSSLS